MGELSLEGDVFPVAHGCRADVENPQHFTDQFGLLFGIGPRPRSAFDLQKRRRDGGFAQAIDTQTWRVEARMGMERQMVDLAVSADGHTLYALENSTQRVFVFDTRRNALVREFALPVINPARIHVGAAP